MYFTSFKCSRFISDDEMKLGKFQVYSAAVYQPKGFNYPKVEWMDIRMAPSGTWIRPRLFINEAAPLTHYVNALWAHYMKRKAYAEIWLEGVHGWDMPGPVICCWCPYERAAQRQIEQFGSFVCHTSVVAKFLHDVYGVPVEFDQDREDKMWKIPPGPVIPYRPSMV